MDNVSLELTRYVIGGELELSCFWITDYFEKCLCPQRTVSSVFYTRIYAEED